ncbi:MAG TPA: SAM-dependent chlorinase/fluorinase [Chitinivibrionales bacterium]|nr:SAM-dependent chlorinase/fluorinase [Chitinivibrionales bacterium]
MSRPVALLTDFGTKDWFVASMKGVILSINPSAVIVDITHHITAGDISSAAFNLLSCHAFFPNGTIFVAVVDPGVGSSRQAIAVKAGPYFFIGPDNGVLSPAIDNYYNPELRSLLNPKYFRKKVSATFHGRDIFAPAAAYLSKGIAFGKLGPRIKGVVRLTMPLAREVGNKIVGCILYLDHFGNAITNIPSSLLDSKVKYVSVKGSKVPMAACYSDVDEGKPLAVIGSCGFVEISVNRGDAARKMRLKVGDKVEMINSGK